MASGHSSSKSIRKQKEKDTDKSRQKQASRKRKNRDIPLEDSSPEPEIRRHRSSAGSREVAEKSPTRPPKKRKKMMIVVSSDDSDGSDHDGSGCSNSPDATDLPNMLDHSDGSSHSRTRPIIRNAATPSEDPSNPTQSAQPLSHASSTSASGALSSRQASTNESKDFVSILRQGENAEKSALSSLGVLKDGARFVCRCISPFMNIQQVLKIGYRLDGEPRSKWRSLVPQKAISEDALVHTVNRFRGLLQMMPAIAEHVDYISSHFESLDAVSKFISVVISRAFADDRKKFKRDLLSSYAPFKDKINRKLPKESRGFYHTTTARLLVDRSKLDEFDRNPAEFCQNVTNGVIGISSNDWPTFMFHEVEEFNPQKIDSTLCRSNFLLTCYQLVLMGGKSAVGTMTAGKDSDSSSEDDSAGGRPPLFRQYKLTEVSPSSIAYAAILGRHALSSQKSWRSDADGEFKYSVFFDNILELFEDAEWADATLSWWNLKAFGKTSITKDNRMSDLMNTNSGLSGIELIRKQRAEQRLLTSVAAEASTQGDGAADQEEGDNIAENRN